ncbi:hypothetical protein [Synechococcus sp. 1G10]|uniref:hypothetical protein n=1 Tax=Synechococcus sp. 1G10 TaxID=2025605 RepID=UPI000B98D234|nr:hypothetical protein [Synechococcus sp. 1G10]
MATIECNTQQPNPRQQVLVHSLRQRIAEARSRHDADTIQALFREAVYLGIQPNLLDQGAGSAG